ncbi:MAG: hypothetical protein LBF67_02580, partial [Prevotellaceae bacterium]|nr:hypothetical protein [Prevotellaceae bacterium]
MKNFYAAIIIITISLFSGGCINLPEPEFSDEAWDGADIALTVTTSEFNVYVKADASLAYLKSDYNSRASDWSTNGSSTSRGFTINNTERYASAILSETEFEYTFEGTPGATYSIRAFARSSSGYNYNYYSAIKTVTMPPDYRIGVRTLPITQIMKTTAVAWGEITSEGVPPYVERGVCYSTQHNPTVESGIGGRQPAPGSGTGEFSVTLFGLTTGTTYYVRAYAIGANGVVYGEEKGFVAGGSAVNPDAGGTATVTLSDYLAISDGLYYYFTPSSNAQSFYWSHYSA